MFQTTSLPPGIVVSYEKFEHLPVLEDDAMAQAMVRVLLPAATAFSMYHTMVLFMTNSNRLIGWHLHSSSSHAETPLNISLIVTMACQVQAGAIGIFKTDMSGELIPNLSDADAMDRLRDVQKLLGIKTLWYAGLSKTEHQDFL